MERFKRLVFLQLLILGALSALSLPPANAGWILGLTVPASLWHLSQQMRSNTKHILFLGWCFGFGYFLAALHWVGFAFLVDAANDLWMMPIALGALAGGMALFWAFATRLAVWLARQGLPLFITWPVSFAAVEWLRGHILTGFPWAVFGQATDGLGSISQLVAVIGMTGLTLLVWLWAACPFAMFSHNKTERNTAIGILALLPLAVFWGQMRLSANPTAYVPNVMIRLVQPNISQSDKWREGNARKIFDQLKFLSAAPSATGQPITHIIWPESAVPFLIDESDDGKAELKATLKPNQVLLTGAVRRASPRDDADYFTSILVFNDKAEAIGAYDKWHLVPGGEFLPLAWLLEPLGLRKVVNLPGSFKPGKGPSTVVVPGLGFAGMSICYEAIFPQALFDPEHRPDVLVNVTNDGWFGNSAGPYQHVAQLRLRAIESGLPVVRAANTGISVIIDPIGRVVLKSQLAATGDFDGLLPQALSLTVYDRYGDLSLFLLLIVTIALGLSLKKL